MGSAGRRRGQLRSAICVCHFLVAVAINVATAAAAKLDIFTNLDIWYRQTGLRNSLLWCKNLRWEAGRNGNLGGRNSRDIPLNPSDALSAAAALRAQRTSCFLTTVWCSICLFAPIFIRWAQI